MYSVKTAASGRGISGTVRIEQPTANMRLQIGSFSNEIVFMNDYKNMPDMPLEIGIGKYPMRPDVVVESRGQAAVGDTIQALTVTSAAVGPAASAISSAISSGTSQGSVSSFRGIMKMIDSLQYLLFENGERIEMSDNFLKPFKQNPLEIFPNPVEIDEDLIECEPDVNFSREGVSCNFLNNYGSSVLTLLLSAGIYGIIRPINWLTAKLKPGSTASKVCLWVFWLPKKVFTLSFIVEMWDGFQIDLI